MSLVSSLSVRTKLVGMVVLTTLVSLASAFAFAVAHDAKSAKRDLVDGTLLLARVVADASVSDLTFADRRESERTLARLAVVPTTVWAHLFDRDGRRFASYVRSRKRASPPAAPPPDGAVFRGGLLEVAEPVAYQGERYGTIWLAVSTAEVDRRIRGWVATAGVATAVLAALVVLAAWRLQRIVTVPLRELADASRRVSADHDYSIRVKRAGDDEIGTLTESFNEMLGEIQRRQEERDRADQRSREKSLFLAHMSHELRTPLNSIIGFSRILLTRSEEEIAPRRQHFLANIRASGEHLLAIIDNILDLSKVEVGRMPITPENVSIPEVVDGVVSAMRGNAAPRRITIRTELEQGLPPIEADPLRLRQILFNLLSNAVKFSPDDSAVTVSARLAPTLDGVPPGVEIAVEDEGIGIDQKDFDLIFERFRQVDGTAGRRFEGAGLGLSLVRSFVEMHHGTIRVESVPKLGSTFTIRLPLRQEATSPGTSLTPGTPPR